MGGCSEDQNPPCPLSLPYDNAEMHLCSLTQFLQLDQVLGINNRS